MQIMIATPLEPELVERIRASGAGHDVDFDPQLLPEPRYPSDHRGRPGFTRDAAQAARWSAMLARAEALFGIPGDTPAGLSEALAAAPRLRFVQATAAGAGEQVRAAGLGRELLDRVAIASAAGAHGTTLAEFTFFGLLALRKDFRRLERIRAERGWDHFAMDELRGSSLAIVGLGNIGRAIARIARAFGMRTIGITRSGTASPEVDETFSTARLSQALSGADAVVVTLPGTEHTRHMLDAGALAALPAHAIVANVGRGAVIDQSALIEALQSGRLAGAVLDVFDPEPLPPDNPLWTMENVIFSPHTAALSVRENERIVDIFCENLQHLARGEALRNRIDPVEFY